jgi:hypothetical protein
MKVQLLGGLLPKSRILVKDPDEYIVLTIPQWHVLNAARAWYRARGSTDGSAIEKAEERLFETVRTLEVADALARAARKNGRPITVRGKKVRTTRPPPPLEGVEEDHPPRPSRTPHFGVIDGGKKPK